MTLSVVVSLLSGAHATIELSEDASPDELRMCAQREFSTGICRLVTSSGSLLPRSGTLKQAGLKDADTVTAVCRDVAVAAASEAFAAILADGSVVAWGNRKHGGDCSAVQKQLQDVEHIQANAQAFAAIRRDGSVVTWGHPYFGGDSSHVQGQLRNVRAIQSSALAFAAILAHGSVVTWGAPYGGGDCQEVRSQLVNVQHIQATATAFAALRADGSVVTWGEGGGDSRAVQAELQNVRGITCNSGGQDQVFAAIAPGGRVVCWGHDDFGADSYGVRLNGVHETGFANVEQVVLTEAGLVATGDGGRLAFVGLNTMPEHDRERIRRLEGVKRILLGDDGESLLALLEDGTLRGYIQDPIISALEQPNIDRVKGFDVYTSHAFAAIRSDGSVFTWGARQHRSVALQLTNVTDIQATRDAFAAIRGDGSVVTWGSTRYGGDSSAVQAQLKNVKRIQSNESAFAAVRADGSVVSWGHAVGPASA